jgi:hypothetical protein
MKEKNDNDNNIELNGEENNLLLLKEQLITKNNEEDNIIDTSSNKKDIILINEDKDEENIEIFIKIRKNGSLKSIVFESNIFFYNNLQIPISLSLISQKDFNRKYNSNDNLINHQYNKDKLTINSGTKKSLSLTYLIKKYRIYISFFDNSNKENYNYSLLYENFNNLKNNYQNFIKYEQENLPNYKGRKETKLDDNYSKLISINHKNKNFYICSNLIIQHGSNDTFNYISNQQNDTKKGGSKNIEIVHYINTDNKENKIDNNQEKQIIDYDNNLSNEIYNYQKAFSYLFIFNESLDIENQLPFNIKCELDGNIKKEVTIRPLQSKYFLDVNQDNSKLKLVLK